MKVNIACWLDRNAAIHRDKPALVCEDRTLGYLELAARARRLADALASRGVGRGDRVATLMYNQHELVETVFACARIGAIAVPLNWRLALDELTFILRDCSPVVLLHDRAEAERAAVLRGAEGSIAHGCEAGGAGAELERWLAEARADRPIDPETGGEDPVELMYTAGTTGLPKGVVLGHDNVFWQTINGWALGISPDAVTLALLPLFHVGGLNGSVMPPLHVGATVVLHAKFEAERVLRAIAEQGVNGVLGVPTVFQMLAELPEFDELDLSGCGFLSGGAPLPESLIARYHGKGLELRQGYGLTETSPGVTGMGPGDCFRKPGTVGRPVLYTEVRLVDADGAEVGPGEIGEILVRGPNVMKGYWNRPEETARALAGGWFHSGDLGRFDEDGYLSIVGRSKEMIISGGETVYPAEIEKLLAGHDEVAMVAVVGVPDPKWGEVAVAVVVPAPGSDLTEEGVVAWCAERLARYKVPRAVRFVPSLPLTGAGKVAKAEVQKMVLEG